MKAHAHGPRLITAQTKNHRKKQWVFKSDVRTGTESAALISSGRSLLNHGALTARALSPSHHQTGPWNNR